MIPVAEPRVQALVDTVRDADSRVEVPPAEAFGRTAAARRRAVPLTVRAVEDAGGFAALRSRWNELLHASEADTPFLTWEWLHTWWVHVGGGTNLRLIVVHAGDELVAIVPTWLVPGPLSWFSRLEFLGTGHAGSDYLDVIVRRGHEAESLAAISDYLRGQRFAVRFTHLPPASCGARLAQRLARQGWPVAVEDDGTCPVVPLAGHTFDSYLATLGPSHRANFRRRLKALDRRFALRFDLVREHAERCEALATLAEYSERRWKDQGGSTAFISPEIRAFQDEVTRCALDRGWLRLYVLRLDGEVAAVMYGLQYGGRFYFYQHGYGDRYRHHSVGLVLMGLTIRAALEEGAREFDMLWGVEPYKFLWAKEARVLQRADLFPVHFGGTLQRRAAEARRRVRKLARRVLSIGESLGS